MKLAWLLVVSLLPVLILPVQAAEEPPRLPVEVRAGLERAVRQSEGAGAHCGLVVLALGKVSSPASWPWEPYGRGAQPVLYGHEEWQRFMPASNLKLYTAVEVLRRSSASTCLVTRLLLGSDGFLYLVGGGDPALDAAALEALAGKAVTRLGKRSVRGVVGVTGTGQAETLGGRYPYGWTLDDSLWYYAPTISRLSVNRNQLDLEVQGGHRPGDPAVAKLSPSLPHDFKVRNLVRTGNKAPENPDFDDCIQVDWPRPDVLVLEGGVPAGAVVTAGLSLPRPELVAARIVQRQLRSRGIVTASPARQGVTSRAVRLMPIAEHLSSPLGDLLRRMLKASDNLYAEMLWRGAWPGAPQTAVARVSSQVEWLRKAGVPTSALRLHDGSGLSRYNMVTPLATARLLAAAGQLREGHIFWDSLPLAGRDGTLRRRMTSTAAAGNARAKTGTFSIVSNLAGYVTTADHHRLAVVVMTNFHPSGRGARDLQDEIFALLAGSRLEASPPGS